MKKTLVLFDFDGTITKKDTLLEFIKYYRGSFAFVIGMLISSPYLLLFKLKLIPNWKAKEKVLSHFFKGESLEVFQLKCNDFASSVIPKLVRSSALKQLKSYLDQGHRVIVVSASAENWIKLWTDSIHVELIGTRMEVKDGKITGKLLGPNCYGPEKVKRLEKLIQKSDYEKIYAYGDSSGDRELLAFATDPFYRHFQE